MEVHNIADEFEKWWVAESPPGTFDKKQCWKAFLGGVIVAERQMENNELKAELKASNILLKDRDALLSAIPECPAHGKCVPHAIEWIEQVKTLAKIISE
jgi:hypothetical protein